MHLQGQAQLAIDLAGIEDQHQQIQRGALQEAPHDCFVLRQAVQVVDAGEVNQLEVLPLELNIALVQVHREPRPITDRRMAAGDAIKEGGFAGIGHAHQGHSHAA